MTRLLRATEAHLLSRQLGTQEGHQALAAQATASVAINALEHALGSLQPHLPAHAHSVITAVLLQGVASLDLAAG